jgi:hypothetical protein
VYRDILSSFSTFLTSGSMLILRKNVATGSTSWSTPVHTLTHKPVKRLKRKLFNLYVVFKKGDVGHCRLGKNGRLNGASQLQPTV